MNRLATDETKTSLDEVELAPVSELSAEPFTPSIQKFFNEAANWPWVTDFPNALFIRDYYDLPVCSPFDIDLMIDVDYQEAFLSQVDDTCAALDLYFFRHQGAGSCFVIIFDFDTAQKGRAWVYLEARSKLKITNEITITAADIDLEREPSTGLPVPSDAWKAFLEIFQGMRTGNIEKAEKRLIAAGIDLNAASSVFKSLLNITVQFPGNLSSAGAELDIIRGLIVKKPRKQPPTFIRQLRTRLGQFIFRNFYFIHQARPLFFSIHGPDGVGKSTTCAQIEKIFDRLPLPFRSFHHISGWKYGNTDTGVKAGNLKPGVRRTGFVHSVLRWGYRRLPISLQSAYVLAQGYHFYLSKLNGMIYQEYCSGRIMLVDRYIYDLVTKNLIQNSGWLFIQKFFTMRARNPVKAFVLTDQPERILARKQELSLDEIKTYMIKMPEIMQRRGVIIETIEISGQPPEAVGRKIAKSILNECGSDLMVLLRSGGQR